MQRCLTLNLPLLLLLSLWEVKKSSLSSQINPTSSVRSSGCFLSATFLEGYIHSQPCGFIFPALIAVFGVTSYFSFKSESIGYCLICVLHGCLWLPLHCHCPLYLPFFIFLTFFCHQNRLFQISTLENRDFFFQCYHCFPCSISSLISRCLFPESQFLLVSHKALKASLLYHTYIFSHLSCTLHLDIEIPVNCSPIFNLLLLICIWKARLAYSVSGNVSSTLSLQFIKVLLCPLDVLLPDLFIGHKCLSLLNPQCVFIAKF